MLRRSLVLVTVLVVAGAGLAACGGDDGGGGSGTGSGSGATQDSGGGATDANLVGTEWILDQERSGLTPVPTAVVTAQFSSDGSLTGNSGCNQYRTPYTVVGSRMGVQGPIATTLMSCGNAADRLASAYLDRLPTARSFGISGSTLTIKTSGDALVYDALDPEAAVAGDWDVINYFRPGAVVSPVPGSQLTATFTDGRISGDSGCNSYTGAYSVDDTKISIGPLASTLRACADPAVGEQESQFLAALELARTFSVAGGNLTLFRDDGGIAVTFARA